MALIRAGCRDRKGGAVIERLADRILALPADVRRELARVDGPGWYFSRRDGAGTLHDCAPYVRPEQLGQRGDGFTDAWLPANPAAAVAAATGCSIWHAHRHIANDGSTGGDIPAALSLIEAHVAGRSSDG